MPRTIKLELIEFEVREKAREAGFPGWIAFRERMPTSGLYDSGLLPDREESTIVRILREDLPPHAIGEPVIYLEYPRKTTEQILATLAHEIGHYEQSPLQLPPVVWSLEWLRREVEAQALGLKWAVKWGVVPQFLDMDRILRELEVFVGKSPLEQFKELKRGGDIDLWHLD